ncbi:EEF1A lysine methyltransferase 2, partial [Acipenser oxyrinchus oxyrinchus]
IQEEDFLSPSPELSGFGVCIDKGTFEAISLNPENAAVNREQYARAVRSVLKDDGLFIITSCNWTKDQLLSILCKGFDSAGAASLEGELGIV